MQGNDFEPVDRAHRDLMVRIQKHEEMLESLMLTREAGAAAQELLEMAGWKMLCGRLADIMAKITDRLQQDPPNDYRVGRAQGFIRACRILTNFRRLTPEELAALEDEVTLVTEKLAELRKLLD
mgnify:CR=1 FL=1